MRYLPFVVTHHETVQNLSQVYTGFMMSELLDRQVKWNPRMLEVNCSHTHTHSQSHAHTLSHAIEPSWLMTIHHRHCKLALSGDKWTLLKLIHLELKWYSDECVNFSVFVCFAEAGSGTLAGVLCAIVAAAIAAVVGYFTYQKKQLCFKNRQGNYLPDELSTVNE